MLTYGKILSKLKQKELVDVILLICWILLNIATLWITINWSREGYYFLATVNIGMTLFICYISGRNISDNHFMTNRIRYYIHTTKRGFLLPVKIIYPKEVDPTETYHTRKIKETAQFAVIGAEVIIKIVLLYGYSFVFDIGNNYHTFELLVTITTVIYFILFFIFTQSTNRPVGLFVVFYFIADITSFLLLFVVLDYTLFLILMVQFTLILIGDKIFFETESIKTLISRSLSHSLLKFNFYVFLIFSLQREDNLFTEDNKYELIWKFVNCEERGSLKRKLEIARKVVAEKLISQCGQELFPQGALVTNYIASCEPGFKLLTKSRVDTGFLITDIKYKLGKKSLIIQIIFVIAFLVLNIFTITSIIYPILMFESERPMANYLLILYTTSIMGMFISGKICLPFARFAYYSRFMVKAPNNLKLDYKDYRRMRNILSSDLRVEDVSNLVLELNILPSDIITIIAEYQRDENDVLQLKCNRGLLIEEE